jgi:hypothetical protein
VVTMNNSLIHLIKKLIGSKHSEKMRHWLRSLSLVRYKGTKYFCPCCEKSFGRFIEFGFPPRPNAACPSCGSLERHRLLWLYLVNRTNIINGHFKVLHFAPEPIIHKNLIDLPNLDYLSADLVPSYAMIRMDITKITFDDKTFDVILLSHVLEFVEDDLKAMKELYRVLKPGGWAILQSAIKSDMTIEITDKSLYSEEEIQFYKSKPWRIYGSDFKERLEGVGFSVRVDRYVRTLDRATIDRYRLDATENIYFCKKENLLLGEA